MSTVQPNQPPQNPLDQKKAGEVLRQIQLIVDNSIDAIIGETLDGTITSWNGGATKMFGYTAQEMIGKSVFMLHPPEQMTESSTLLSKIGAGEIIADYDTMRLRKDGSKIPIAISLSPVRTKDGKIIGASSVERDITIRKKAEEVLRQTQLIVENSTDAIISETLDGIITSWNAGAAKMFGYSAQEMIGKSILLLLPPEMKDDIAALLNKINAGEVIADHDSIRIRKDGSRIDVSISGSPIRTENSNIIGASIVERDITVRKQEERHIIELNEVRSKFIEIISHQLRTPLTAVNWNLESILNGDFGKLEDTQYKFLHATHESSMKIANRAGDLIEAMDIEERRVTFLKEDVSIDNLTATILNGLKERCKIKSIVCEYTAPVKELPVIQADSEKIRKTIFNLLDNAIIYTKEGGKIIVKLELAGDTIHLEVKDNGVGVPTPEQHRIFTRFFRASNASIMQPDAFGLGLFTAKYFIERNNGKIGFKSKEGEGSTFWLEIPL